MGNRRGLSPAQRSVIGIGQPNFFVLKKSTFVSVDSAEFSWQEFVDNYRTFAIDIECNVKRVRELLDIYS